MAAERTGGSELAQLVADHIFLNINGNVLATVVDGDRVTDEGGEDGGAAAPGLQDLLLTGLVHLFDSLDQLRGNKRAFFNASAHFYIASFYLSLRRLTMNLFVGFFFERVL